jgi:steroid 5-alpha reductase family enzyme
VICLYPLAVFCAATAIVAFRTRALPRWLAAGAAVTAATLAINGAFLGTDSVPALLLFLLWTLLASVHLLRRTWRKPAPAPAAEAVARA